MKTFLKCVAGWIAGIVLGTIIAKFFMNVDVLDEHFLDDEID